MTGLMRIAEKAIRRRSKFGQVWVETRESCQK